MLEYVCDIYIFLYIYFSVSICVSSMLTFLACYSVFALRLFSIIFYLNSNFDIIIRFYPTALKKKL